MEKLLDKNEVKTNTSKKAKWSKKRKILTGITSAAGALVIAGGTTVGAIAGVKLNQLATEQTAFNGTYLQSIQDPNNSKVLIEKGFSDNFTDEQTLVKTNFDKFFNATSNSGKTISIQDFSNQLQDTMLGLFNPFLIKLQQLEDQLPVSPLAGYAPIKVLYEGFAHDAINLIKTYQAAVVTSHAKAFAGFATGLGNLIYTYMVQPFGAQITTGGDLQKYIDTNGKNGQDLLITLLSDHILFNISGGLFRQAVEAPNILINKLLSEGITVQKSPISSKNDEASLYLKALTGPLGMTHMADLIVASNAFDGVTWDMNKNLDDILSHPLFHNAANTVDNAKIIDGINLFKNIYNSFILVPTDAATKQLYAIQLYVRSNIATSGLEKFVESNVLNNNASFLNDTVVTGDLYTNSNNMKSFLIENADHFATDVSSYIQTIQNVSNTNNWFTK